MNEFFKDLPLEVNEDHLRQCQEILRMLPCKTPRRLLAESCRYTARLKENLKCDVPASYELDRAAKMLEEDDDYIESLINEVMSLSNQLSLAGARNTVLTEDNRKLRERLYQIQKVVLKDSKL